MLTGEEIMEGSFLTVKPLHCLFGKKTKNRSQLNCSLKFTHTDR